MKPPRKHDVDEVLERRNARLTARKGALRAPSAWFMKSPPEQWSDDVAHTRLERFIAGEE